MTIYDVAIHDLQGKPLALDGFRDRALLIVNVASRCGQTPQYFGLEALQKEFGERGLTVLGVPCNQFGGQEPGSSEEIAEFCSTTYGVTFPMTEKVDVNGEGRHPLYDRLVGVADATGHSGDIRWNFEKFVVAPGGEITARFGHRVQPEDEGLRAAVESALPA
ncbi:glutathione peroxidase [Virgisporangium aliadipatigenens]|uniref:Glutathione peroxidase n=1 Tax=Virgisporangium aliadipatigenens TaxID=741659 RepID=A0A8J4DN43_9ACTN|nr:glutathione peroxidase [Virgisporangium aliadipatigenens]GIJ43436.1 glutathione peroxidase [Virgisporangium aliadipatigenens]